MHHLVHSNGTQSVSEYKYSFLSSFIHINHTHSETSLHYHHFLHPNSANQDDVDKKNSHDLAPTSLFATINLKNHMHKISSLRIGPISGSSRACHVINGPNIFTPQMTHQNKDLINSLDEDPNELSPILSIFKEEGIVICVNDLQYEKAPSPIDFTEEGIVICVNDEQ